MMDAIGALFIAVVTLVVWLVLGPVVAAVLLAVAVLILAVVAMPVAVMLLPWLVILGAMKLFF